MNERLMHHGRSAEGWYQEWYVPRVLRLPKQRRLARRKYRRRHRQRKTA